MKLKLQHCQEPGQTPGINLSWVTTTPVIPPSCRGQKLRRHAGFQPLPLLLTLPALWGCPFALLALSLPRGKGGSAWRRLLTLFDHLWLRKALDNCVYRLCAACQHHVLMSQTPIPCTGFPPVLRALPSFSLIAQVFPNASFFYRSHMSFIYGEKMKCTLEYL